MVTDRRQISQVRTHRMEGIPLPRRNGSRWSTEVVSRVLGGREWCASSADPSPVYRSRSAAVEFEQRLAVSERGGWLSLIAATP